MTTSTPSANGGQSLSQSQNNNCLTKSATASAANNNNLDSAVLAAEQIWRRLIDS